SRTGDIATMDENGVFTFLTRRDGQIKHMGYRIELGEIETALNSIPSIKEVACLFDRERDRIHCVYTGGEDSKALAKTARSILPRYMVPNIYHQLDEMPHNPNGKIDRPKLREEFLNGKN
ncbi:MAG: D-alanine--poly(phosphoribitol) ligase, partial [Ruminiclostridium sp.]|nr:D-alanine--poly(phosphoribitol) ligase [Ruminiclostridium sp.]